MSLANLQTIETQLEARIISVTASDQPDYHVNGQSFSRARYLEVLMAQLKAVKGLIQQDGGNMFEVYSRIVT